MHVYKKHFKDIYVKDTAFRGTGILYKHCYFEEIFSSYVRVRFYIVVRPFKPAHCKKVLGTCGQI